MDSLTQIVLGAAVAELSLGKKIGNKAILWGAVAGTIPDLDVLAKHFTDTVGAIEFHRGITHSLVFCLVLAPILGFLVPKLYRKKEANNKEWTLLFFWALVTHPILDAHTTWGTQFFWPLDIRLAFKNIFVIDPLYTLPFLICLLIGIRYKRSHLKRRYWVKTGVLLSSAYLLLTLGVKWYMHGVFTNALQHQGISYSNMSTKPMPFTSILWTANVETKEDFLIGYYSFFDADKQIAFRTYPKNHELAANLPDTKALNRLKKISEGWYTLSLHAEGHLVFNDLRFGLLSAHPKEEKFAFSYIIESIGQETVVKEVPKNPEDASNLLKALFARIFGQTTIAN
ncbi:MAG: metal-dependent hydrolase [Flavobacteriaceae bacterium]|nr:metal-dependent hydrolase [Flavobacteriaceae bacterium]